MKFLFVHSWRGFSLAEWYFREVLAKTRAIPLMFRALEMSGAQAGTPILFREIVSVWKPDVVGFSCHAWSVELYLEAAQWAKHLHPGVTVVFGGPHTNSPQAAEAALAACPQIDFIVRGAGEEALRLLLESLHKKSMLKKIPGLSFRKEDAVIHNSPSPRRNWSRGIIFHPENRDLIARIDGLEVLPYETLRGCRNSCAYCQYHGIPYAILDTDLVECELEFILSYSFPVIKICDSHFGGDAARAKRLLRFFAKKNRGSCIRINPDLAHIDDEYIALIKAANAEITTIGIQSTNAAALDCVDRAPAERHRGAISLIVHNFPATQADLIIGLPGDSVEGVRKSLKDVLAFGFSRINTFPMTLFPSTRTGMDPHRYYGEGPLVSTKSLQLISSPAFPVETHARLSSLLHAFYLAKRLISTRANLAKTRGDILDLLEMTDPLTILYLNEHLNSDSPVQMLMKIGEIPSLLFSICKNDIKTKDSLVYDILFTLFERNSQNGRRFFECCFEGGTKVIKTISVRLYSGDSVEWEISQRRFSLVEAGTPNNGELTERLSIDLPRGINPLVNTAN